MKVARLDSLHADAGKGNFDFLKVTADNGLVGWSEYNETFGGHGVTAAIEGLTPAMLVALGEKGVKSLDDLADLAADELNDEKDGILKDFEVSTEDANAIIMAARAHWFADEKQA